MGYHIIIKKAKLELVCEYVETQEELFNQLIHNSEITEETIIYEGEKHKGSVLVGNDKKYKEFIQDWFRAGLRAQDLFEEQAVKQGLILQTLNQDQKSFKNYTDNSKGIKIKRGDFLIRNVKNLEVDVKCRTFYREHGERYFNFKKDHFEKHINMIKLTSTPIVIAVYERIKAKPNPNQLFMFDIRELETKIHEGRIKIHNHHDKNVGECYKIPIGLTKKGFKLIEQYQNKHNI